LSNDDDDDDDDDDDGGNIEIADDTVDFWRRLANTIGTTPSKGFIDI
jgi:hypothetical protein